ncbi:BAG domain-containing protein Samui-like isoform X1 [Maniola jurtina]|uniref:BAG domain-containing protein Samui-like isoform X1 n=1 Tax=Maniola jurtina TaxID=191418 RepID=UPI001E68CC75|nr:BAG domain-containing protein Samui-like isoform X1 [Maniola jurtina]
MESPVVLDKPPEYHGNERGFPFDEEEGSDAWSELAARHPDIAARLRQRQRPPAWARKRRPSSQDGIDDTADSFGGFDFPFDDIPQDFREHFPSHWNRRFGSRDEPYQQPTSPQPQAPQQQTTATQTEHDAGPSHLEQTLPQYGLRNTVDLGQKSAADPSVVDAEDRAHRSVSAPPDQRADNPNSKMSGQSHQDQPHPPPPEQHSNVRHIPIFVEGRDEPVINRSVDHGTHFADPKPTYVPPPQPHIDREQYFANDEPVGFHSPFSKPFFRQSPQPFTKQKMYPQAFARGGSPQRSQSPKPQSYHEHAAPRPETPSRPQQKQAPPQQKQTPPQQKQPPQQPKQPSPPQRQTTPQPATSPQPPHHEETRPQSPPQDKPTSNDPLNQILTIQKDVLNLITEVENFKGTKKDKHYLYLDEMLTRNLIKLDNIETDGKESIRQGRKEVVKCINDCIAMLERKADSRALTTPPPQDVEMQNTATETPAEEQAVQNGDVEMNETTKETEPVQPQIEQEQVQENITSPQVQAEAEMKEDVKPDETKQPAESKEAEQSDVQPEETKIAEPTPEVVPEPPAPQEVTEKKKVPKKTGKKRDKSKDNKEVAKESKKEEVVDTKETKDCNKDNVGKTEVNESDINKQENENKPENVEVMQVDAKGDTNKPDSQAMEVDGAASQ